MSKRKDKQFYKNRKNNNSDPNITTRYHRDVIDGLIKQFIKEFFEHLFIVGQNNSEIKKSPVC